MLLGLRGCYIVSNSQLHYSTLLRPGGRNNVCFVYDMASFNLVHSQVPQANMRAPVPWSQWRKFNTGTG